MEPQMWIVSPSPHILEKRPLQSAMTDVLIALIPAFLAGIYFFGLATLRVVSICMISCLGTEFIIHRVTKRNLIMEDRLAALVTGVLLAFCLPPQIPLWIAILGGIIAIALVKELFGGLGFNIFNPALAARAVLLASWPVAMTKWTPPRGGTLSGFESQIPDAIASATPLNVMKLAYTYRSLPETVELAQRIISQFSHPHLWWKLFIGRVGGSLGETSALALLVGAAYLLGRKVIDWRIPVSYLGSVLGLSLLLGRDPVFNLLAGGIFLGAFYMATDYVTSPVTKKGRWIFGVGCGTFTVIIRFFGGYPEGVCYSILIMNMLVPLIDQFTPPRVFGKVKKIG